MGDDLRTANGSLWITRLKGLATSRSMLRPEKVMATVWPSYPGSRGGAQRISANRNLPFVRRKQQRARLLVGPGSSDLRFQRLVYSAGSLRGRGRCQSSATVTVFDPLAVCLTRSVWVSITGCCTLLLFSIVQFSTWVPLGILAISWDHRTGPD